MTHASISTNGSGTRAAARIVMAGLIATGFGEAAVAVAQAVQHLRPDAQLQPGYSTNTGVPGVVAGQP